MNVAYLQKKKARNLELFDVIRSPKNKYIRTTWKSINANEKEK